MSSKTCARCEQLEQRCKRLEQAIHILSASPSVSQFSDIEPIPVPVAEPEPIPVPVVEPEPLPVIDIVTDIRDMSTRYDNPGTYANVCNYIHKLNAKLGLEASVVHCDIYNSRCMEVADALVDALNIKDHHLLESRLRSICGAMQKTNMNKKPGNLYWFARNCAREYKFKQVDIDISKESTESKLAVIPIWETETLPQLRELATNGTPIARVIATMYSHEFVQRPWQLFNTVLVNDPNFNYLDLDGLMLHVRFQKNKKTGSFPIPQELADSIRKLCPGPYLLAKSNGKPYARSAIGLTYAGYKWPQHLKDSIVRKSYEDWNVNRSGRTRKEQEYWHSVLGHSHTSVMNWYANRPTSVNQMPRAPVEPEPAEEEHEVTWL